VVGYAEWLFLNRVCCNPLSDATVRIRGRVDRWLAFDVQHRGDAYGVQSKEVRVCGSFKRHNAATEIRSIRTGSA
jgi:hypothetical protein